MYGWKLADAVDLGFDGLGAVDSPVQFGAVLGEGVIIPYRGGDKGKDKK